MTITGISPKKAGKTALLIAWMALIFLFSADSSSGAHSRSLLLLICEFFHLPPDPTLHFWLRKGAHFTEYAILCGLWQWNLGRPGLSLLLTILYAGTDELHQAFVPQRGPSLRDVGIDSLGALAMGSLVRAFRRSRPGGRLRRPGPG